MAGSMGDFAEHITKQLMSDLNVMARAQNHDFIALTSQNRSFSSRCSQQMEKQVVEFDYQESMALRPFDPMASNFMLQSERQKNNSILVNEEFLLKILSQRK
jgi:hypothetical protein